jgi:hypothetical protein
VFAVAGGGSEECERRYDDRELETVRRAADYGRRAEVGDLHQTDERTGCAERIETTHRESLGSRAGERCLGDRPPIPERVVPSRFPGCGTGALRSPTAMRTAGRSVERGDATPFTGSMSRALAGALAWCICTSGRADTRSAPLQPITPRASLAVPLGRDPATPMAKWPSPGMLTVVAAV